RHAFMMLRLFFIYTATTDIYTLSLHDALPISRRIPRYCQYLIHAVGPQRYGVAAEHRLIIIFGFSFPRRRDLSAAISPAHCTVGRTRPILGQRYRTLRGCCAVNLWLSGPASDPTPARQHLPAYRHQRTSSHALNDTGSLVVVSDSTAAELAGVLTPEGFELPNRLWREGTYASADTLKLAASLRSAGYLPAVVNSV